MYILLVFITALACSSLAVSAPPEQRAWKTAMRALSDTAFDDSDVSAVYADQAIDWDLEPRPIDFIRGRHGGHRASLDPTIRGGFVRNLVSKGVALGTAETVGMALGEDEISNLPPQMIQHMISALLTIETTFKSSQTHLAMADAGVQFLLSTLLPAEQLKVQIATQAALSPVGLLYGNDAVVKRISQALVGYFHRKLADPYPWTYQVGDMQPVQLNEDGSLAEVPKELSDALVRTQEYTVNRQRVRTGSKFLRQFANAEFNEDALTDYLKSKSVKDTTARKQATVLTGLLKQALSSPSFSIMSDDEEDDEAVQKRTQQLKALFTFVRKGEDLLNVIGDMLDFVEEREPTINEVLWTRWDAWLKAGEPIMGALMGAA